MMNNRIEELAQCNERILNFFQTGPVQRAAIEEFAELIVRECAGMCNDVGNAVWAEQHQSNMGTAQTCKAAIQKRFGVEW
jgi:predicted ATPase